MNHEPLSLHLEGLLKQFREARREQERRMTEWYSDYMRIARDDDTKGVGVAKSRQAKAIFVGSTRGKVRAARAKIVDSLFGANVFPFDTEPQSEELKEFADTFETILEHQLRDMKAEKLLRNGTDEICVYGTGFIFGPFVETKSKKIPQKVADPIMGYRLDVQEYSYPCPKFELAQTIEVYPDPAATDEQEGDGIFWCSLHSKAELRRWAKSGQYQNIDEAMLIASSGDAGTVEGRKFLEQARANLQFWYDSDSKRIRVARFFGYVPADMFAEYIGADDEVIEGEPPEAEPEDESDHPEEYIPAMVMMAGGVVIRAERLPWEKRPAARCVYEEVPHEMWGVGIGENNAPTQKMTNAAVRLFFEGKGHALLPTRSVDKSKFLPTEDFKHFPGKVYQFKPNLTPEERKEAIQFHVTPDVSDGWIDAIQYAEQLSDDDTSITKYTQGNDANHLNKTATGVSMIMGAASLPLKEVLQNIDEMWIERIVTDLIEWDLEFLSVEHVQMLHGDEVAQKWAIIKEHGQASFMKWRATGAATFMAKEVLLNKLMGFTNLVGSNPNFAALVDARELLEQLWDLTQVGRESPILKDEDLTIDKLPPQVQQMIMQLQQAAAMGEQAAQEIERIRQEAAMQIGQREETISKLELQLQHKGNADATAQFNADTKRMEATGDLLIGLHSADKDESGRTGQPEG